MVDGLEAGLDGGHRGREDADAWAAYLSTLDRGSALYAQVKARIELIDRRYRR